MVVPLRHERGGVVARLEIVVEAAFAGSRLELRAQLLRGELALEPGERVTGLERRSALTLAGVCGAAVLTRVVSLTALPVSR